MNEQELAELIAGSYVPAGNGDDPVDPSLLEESPFAEPGETPMRGSPDDRFRLTDLGNAERLVAKHGSDLRFAPGLGWACWDGRRWKPDADGEVMRRAKLTVRSIYTEASGEDDDERRKKLVVWAAQSESVQRLRAAITLAESERQVVVNPDELDADPWLLNVANGTIDLRSGQLREHRREDLLTKITQVVYDPAARSQLWEDFLETTTRGHDGLPGYLRRAVGYSLSGHTSEEVLFFTHGPTATGKSSKHDAIRAVLGEYGSVADFETFLKRHGDAGIRNDIARLAGTRFVSSVEVDDGRALAEGLLKLLTGGDTVTARFMYRDLFEFRPVFKLWLAANERPKARAGDDALWRRVHVIPFTNTIPAADRDERVKRELRTNPQVHSAILAWAVQGCLEWQRVGLDPPPCVLDSTAQYRAENDPLRDWLTDSCQLDGDAWTATSDLRASYETWCEANGEKPAPTRTLTSSLAAHGCQAAKSAHTRGWKGIRLA